MAQISYGSITIVDTTDIQRFYVQYAQNNSSAVAPTTGWSQERPTWFNGSYIWQRTVTKKQGVALTSLDYGNPVCITGAKGDPGQQGNTGNGISSIVTMYCNYGSGTPSENYQYWSSNVPEYDKDKPNYWVKTTVNYTSGNPNVTIYKDLGITEAVEKANLANATAQTAESHSIEAISIADSKNRIYYSSTFPTQGNYIDGDTLFKESSNGTVLYIYDKTYNDNVSGHWKQQQFEENAIANLAITNAKIKDLHGDKITANTIAANKLIAHSITTNQLATDAIKSSNYTAGTAPYSGTGTFLDLSNGNIYTPNFGVNNSNDNIIDGAYIKGSIYAYDGTIGSNNTNYWYIGNYLDYNQGNSAMIRSYGTATIQLGGSNTWRISTNRIHTSWNDDSTSSQAFRLHYPVYSSKYWDSGLHVPTSATDKFLYIRNADTTYSLENLQNALEDSSGLNYWKYLFYITNDGSLYAKNIYVIDQNGNTTQVGGTDGVYLLKSGGQISGTLNVVGALSTNSTIKIASNLLNKDGNAITLRANLASTSAATLTGNSTSPIQFGVTGTLPVANGGTGNTNYTSGGVVYVSNTNPKTLLSNAAGTSGQLLASGGSGAPTWVNASGLSVNYAVSAGKATNDKNDNDIATTYMPIAGGTFTGQIIASEGIEGDLVGTVNGFTLGMDVPSGSKLTDTVTTVTTSGNGNAITSITATNGKITATKGEVFLTSFTEVDPVFSASAAASIQQNDIDNWNSKTSNTGTVTSVRVQASSPLQSSVSSAQSSSLNTTISFVNQNINTVLAGPSSGTAAAPSFRKLVSADIPNLAWSKITSGNDDLKAIESLTGTSGLLKKTAANTWSLDTTAYVPTSRTINGHNLSNNISITKTDVGLGNVENALQIIDIGSNDAGQLVLTFGDNTTETRTVSITATTSSSVAKAEALNTNGVKVGNTNQPVYFGTDGKPVAISYTIEKSVPSDAIFSYSFDGTYNASTNKAATVATVTNAINALNGGTIGTGGVGKTITSLSQVNGQISATFENISITKSQISDFPSSLTPTSHTHGNISNSGTISSTTIALANGDNLLFADSSNNGKIERSSITIGTGTTKYLRQDGTWGTPAGTYSLPLASSSTRGGVKIGYSSSGQKYAVQLSSEKMYVQVPWTDHTYDAATANPLMDGVATIGISEKYAREDHIHPSDTSKVSITRTINGHALDSDITITKSDVGLGNVENTKLSTWAGSSNLTTTKVGTLAAAAAKGVTTTLDTSANLPTAAAISSALEGYVTLTTGPQTISGRKTFNDLAAVTFKASSGNDYCNINYNSALGALVFSFG